MRTPKPEGRPLPAPSGGVFGPADAVAGDAVVTRAPCRNRGIRARQRPRHPRRRVPAPAGLVAAAATGVLVSRKGRANGSDRGWRRCGTRRRHAPGPAEGAARGPAAPAMRSGFAAEQDGSLGSHAGRGQS
jgi:hypothetical protein